MTNQCAGLMLFHEQMSVEGGGIDLAPLAAEIAAGRARDRGRVAERLVDRDFTGKAALHIR